MKKTYLTQNVLCLLPRHLFLCLVSRCFEDMLRYLVHASISHVILRHRHYRDVHLPVFLLPLNVHPSIKPYCQQPYLVQHLLLVPIILRHNYLPFAHYLQNNLLPTKPFTLLFRLTLLSALRIALFYKMIILTATPTFLFKHLYFFFQ